MLLRTAALATFAATALAGLAAPARAQTHDIVLPSCPGFDVGVDVSGTAPTPREFHDRDGNLVKTIAAGKGQTLTFTNMTTERTTSLKANGAVNITRPGPGDLSTVTAMGHNVFFLFPTDVPPGPSTTLYIGRVVYTVAPDFTFTLLKTTGRKVDLCAALS